MMKGVKGSCSAVMAAGTLLLALAVLSSSSTAEAARIAMFGFPSGPSHHMVFSKVGRELVSRGHEVLFIKTNLDGKHANLDELEVYTVESGMSQKEAHEILQDMATLDPVSGWYKIFDVIVRQCEAKIADAKLLDLLKSCDAVVLDPNYMCAMFMAEAAGFDVNVHLSPTNFFDPFISIQYGVPIPLATVPHMGTKYGPEMTFPQRLHNAIVYAVDYYIRWHVIEPKANELRSKLGLSGSFYKTFHNVTDIIYQTDFSFEFPRLITPSVRMVGPILPEPAVPVQDAKIRDILDNAPHGVVLVSFGTIARLDKEHAQMLASAFGKLKQKVIWKFNGERPDVADNTLLADWVEQNNILGHSNVRAFVAHGGANGILEAAYHGVPLVGFALFADQWDNIMRAQYRGSGILIDKETVTPETLDDALNKVINDPSYRKNAKAISAEMRDRLRTPTQEAADIVERSYRRKGAFRHRMVALDLPWYINAGLDIIAFFVMLAVVLLLSCVTCMRCLCCQGHANKSHGKMKAKKTK